MHVNHTKIFQISAEWLSPHCQREKSLFSLAWSAGLLFSKYWHSLHRQLMSREISWKCQHFLVELLSPQTSSHPSCTAHCRTRAGASLCLAATSQQAQELPGITPLFKMLPSQTVFKIVFWRAKNIFPALRAAFPITFIICSVYAPHEYPSVWTNWMTKLKRRGQARKCWVPSAGWGRLLNLESRTEVFLRIMEDEFYTGPWASWEDLQKTSLIFQFLLNYVLSTAQDPAAVCQLCWGSL